MDGQTPVHPEKQKEKSVEIKMWLVRSLPILFKSKVHAPCAEINASASGGATQSTPLFDPLNPWLQGLVTGLLGSFLLAACNKIRIIQNGLQKQTKMK